MGSINKSVRFSTIDGKEYVELTPEYYQHLQEEREINRKVRYKGVEELRLWCQANKGTTTLEEGLRACTAEELYQAASRAYSGINMWTYALNLLYALYLRLEEREKKAVKEKQAVAVTTIMPEDEDDADYTG